MSADQDGRRMMQDDQARDTDTGAPLEHGDVWHDFAIAVCSLDSTDKMAAVLKAANGARAELQQRHAAQVTALSATVAQLTQERDDQQVWIRTVGKKLDAAGFIRDSLVENVESALTELTALRAELATVQGENRTTRQCFVKHHESRQRPNECECACHRLPPPVEPTP